MDTSGKLKVIGNKAYQHIDNGGVTYEVDVDGNFHIETSYFGHGSSRITIPFFNKEELIAFLQKQ